MIFTDPSMINEDHTELINTYKEQVENNMLNRNQDHINNNVLLNKIIDQIEIKKKHVCVIFKPTEIRPDVYTINISDERSEYDRDTKMIEYYAIKKLIRKYPIGCDSISGYDTIYVKFLKRLIHDLDKNNIKYNINDEIENMTVTSDAESYSELDEENIIHSNKMNVIDEEIILIAEKKKNEMHILNMRLSHTSL